MICPSRDICPSGDNDDFEIIPSPNHPVQPRLLWSWAVKRATDSTTQIRRGQQKSIPPFILAHRQFRYFYTTYRNPGAYQKKRSLAPQIKI